MHFSGSQNYITRETQNGEDQSQDYGDDIFALEFLFIKVYVS